MERCPICGSQPRMEVTDLGKPNGRGYPGHNSYTLECPKCGFFKAETADIYDTNSEIKASERVALLWDKRVKEIEHLMKWRKETVREVNTEKLGIFRRNLVKSADKSLYGPNKIHRNAEKQLLKYMQSIGEGEAVELYMLCIGMRNV